MTNEKLRDPLVDQFFQAILSLENIEECYRFFEDVATVAELKALAQRLEVARMLQEGHTTTTWWPGPAPAPPPSAG